MCLVMTEKSFNIWFKSLVFVLFVFKKQFFLKISSNDPRFYILNDTIVPKKNSFSPLHCYAELDRTLSYLTGAKMSKNI